jgi:hypothetical protein
MLHLYNLQYFRSSYGKISAPEQIGLLELSCCTGKAFTVTVAVAVNGREQVPLLTLVRFKVVSAVTAVTVTLTVPPAPIVAVPDAAV